MVTFNKLTSKEVIKKILDSGVNNICLVNNNKEFNKENYLDSLDNIYFLNNENLGGLAGAYNKALDYIYKIYRTRLT